MRNILITVMMLIVVAVMFTGIVSGDNGIRSSITSKGTETRNAINALTPQPTTP